MNASKVQRFWKWFSENAARISGYGPDQLNVTNEIIQELRRIHQPEEYKGGGPSLCFEINSAGKSREFIVSADGIDSAFHLAQELIAEAPSIPGWTFKALIPRRSVDQVLADSKLGADDVWFKLDSAGGQVNVLLFIKNLSTNSEHDPAAVRPFLLYTLGEETFGTRVDAFDCQRLPPDPQKWGLKPLKLLPETVDALPK